MRCRPWPFPSRQTNLENDAVRLSVVDLPTFRAYLEPKARPTSEVMFQVFSHRLGRLVGCASLMNVRPDHGSLEAGSIWYAREAQKTEVNADGQRTALAQRRVP